MLNILRKIFFSLIFNSGLLILLILVIQNSSNKSKISIIFNETVQLPISFICGLSFISGSLTGSLFSIKEKNENNNLEGY